MKDRKAKLPSADPLIDEVRAIRKAISDQFDNDVGKLCGHLREIERQYADRLVEPVRPDAAGPNAPQGNRRL